MEIVHAYSLGCIIGGAACFGIAFVYIILSALPSTFKSAYRDTWLDVDNPDTHI